MLSLLIEQPVTGLSSRGTSLKVYTMLVNSSKEQIVTSVLANPFYSRKFVTLLSIFRIRYKPWLLRKFQPAMLKLKVWLQTVFFSRLHMYVFLITSTWYETSLMNSSYTLYTEREDIAS